MGRILSRGGGNVSKDEDHHQTIAETLEEDRRRQEEEAEKFKTPPPKGEVSGAFRRVSGGVSVDDTNNSKEVSGVSVEKRREEEDNVLPPRGAVGRDGEDISSNTCPGKTTETPESPSPLAVSTTETSPETTEKVRKPPEQKGDDDGVHGVHGGGLSATKKDTTGERPSLSEPALKTLLDESGEITPERYVAQAGGTPGAAIRQLDLACAAYGWKKRKVGFSVIYGPGGIS